MQFFERGRIVKVLVACEYSGVVSGAFRALGHTAYSCDLLPTEGDGRWHMQADVLKVLTAYVEPWDLLIAHPPCTHLAVSGARWFKDKAKEQAEAVQFFMKLARANVPRVCIENPVCIMSRMWRKPDQIVQPWQFGHGETKATCLWLRGLQKLTPTNIVEGREHRVHRMPPGPDRWKDRSRTFVGIARAMAEQWGSLDLHNR